MKRSSMLMLLWLGLAPTTVVGADAAGKLRLNVLEVHTAQFPKIAIDVQPLKAKGGPLRKLDVAQVAVMEDGVAYDSSALKLQRLADVQDASATRMNVVLAVANCRGLDRERIGAALAGLTDRLDKAEQACIVIQEQAPPQPPASGNVQPRARLWQKFTADKHVLALACKDYDLTKFTALYDLLMFALNIERGRYTPIVVVSDGFDDSSRYTKEHVIAKAQEQGRPIFTIGVRTGLLRKRYRPAPLIELAERTGGRYYECMSDAPMQWLYDHLKAFRQNQFRISYLSKNHDPDRHVRQISVQIDTTDLGKASASVQIDIPRDLIWNVRIAEVKAQLAALTSTATRGLHEAQSELDQASIAIIKGNKASAIGDYPKAKSHYDEVEQRLAKAKQAAQAASAAAAHKTATPDEQHNADVSNSLLEAQEHRTQAKRIIASAEEFEAMLALQRVLLGLREAAAAPALEPLDSPRIKRACQFVAAHRAEIKPDQYAEIHRLLSSVFMSHVARHKAFGHDETVAELCERLIKLLPDDVKGTDNYEAELELARSLAKQKQWNKAEKHYREAIRRKPKNVEPRRELAEVLAQLNRPDDSVKEAHVAASLGGNNAPAEKTLGELLYKKGEYATAAEHLAAAVKQYPALRTQLADCYERLQQYDKGIEVYRSIIDDGGASPRAHARFAWLLWRAHHNEQAAAIIKHCRIALDSNALSTAERAQTLNVLGVCLYNLGSWDEGVRDCVEAIRLAPELANDHEVLRASNRE